MDATRNPADKPSALATLAVIKGGGLRAAGEPYPAACAQLLRGVGIPAGPVINDARLDLLLPEAARSGTAAPAPRLAMR